MVQLTPRAILLHHIKWRDEAMHWFMPLHILHSLTHLITQPVPPTEQLTEPLLEPPPPPPPPSVPHTEPHSEPHIESLTVPSTEPPPPPPPPPPYPPPPPPPSPTEPPPPHPPLSSLAKAVIRLLLTKAATRRLARRGGVKRISWLTYEVEWSVGSRLQAEDCEGRVYLASVSCSSHAYAPHTTTTSTTSSHAAHNTTYMGHFTCLRASHAHASTCLRCLVWHG